MLCTSLLLFALAAAGPGTQEIAPSQPHSRPAPAPPRDAKNPFARLFRFESNDPVSGANKPTVGTVPIKLPIARHERARSEDESTEIICGMTVARKSSRIDPGIALPADRSTGLAVRRVEPGVCGMNPSR